MKKQEKLNAALRAQIGEGETFSSIVRRLCRENKLDIMVMLFTDVMGNGSMFYYYGPMAHVVASVIETTFDDHSGFDPNIISRKQQLMPKLSEVLLNL